MDVDSLVSSIMFSAILSSGLVILVTVGILVFVIKAIGRANNAGVAAAQMKMPVPGSLLVTAASMPTETAIYQSGRLTGVITAEGVDAVAVQLNGLFRSSKWPRPGQTLPVIVDRADPNRFAIDWDKVAEGTTDALNQAQQIAAAMRAGQAQGESPANPGGDYTA
jgi:hypothetical protein